MTRKLLVIIPLLLLFLMGGSQTLAKSPPDTTKLTVKEVYEDAKSGLKDVKEGIVNLSSKLEGPAKHVYSVYVYQNEAKGISFGLLTLIFALTGFFLLRRGFALCKIEDDDKKFNDDDAFTRMTLATFIIGIITSVVGLILLVNFFGGDYFTQVINPEYYAIQDVIKVFK